MSNTEATPFHWAISPCLKLFLSKAPRTPPVLPSASGWNMKIHMMRFIAFWIEIRTSKRIQYRSS